MNNIIKHIVKKAGSPDLVGILSDSLSFSDLQSLLLMVYHKKISASNVSTLFQEYRSNRFVQPSVISPVEYNILDRILFSGLPDGFKPVALSPVTPLGTCSLLGPVHQNNIISTIRNSEVVSDVTNVMGLECARQRKRLLKTHKKATDKIKLAVSHRQIRGQAFEDENFTPHFSIFALCTAGRDEGNFTFEKETLTEHICFYLDIIKNIVDVDQIKKTVIKCFSYEGTDNSELLETLQFLVKGKKIDLQVEQNSGFGKHYYKRLRFMINLTNFKNQSYDFIDGGFTDWTARLLENKKERLLTSGIGTELFLKAFDIKWKTNI